ncbi:hypothetical protein [Mycobacterium sp. NAZ190054]|uniref:hypothetical protein n=1 Tax=Mycobacterium sp. NAZ190054 TaxID=1747766 RepID=UPI001E4456EC|nr:hypothetical protein [Mycobacterium sp. NAZ190054]
MNKFLVSGAAVVVAGAIAVNPVAPVASAPDIRQAAVQLAANPVLENPLLVWQNNFTNTFSQIGAIGTSLWENPFPILNQIGENQLAHLRTIIGQTAEQAGTRRGTGIIGAAEGVQRTLTNLPVRLQAVAEFLGNGQFTEAFVEMNTWMLVAMENLAFPLTSILTIPKAIADAVGRVYDSLITRGNIVTISKGLMSPPITAFFAAMNVADTVFASVKEGNLKDAFTALVNAPGLITGAFLNGYKPYFGTDENGDPIYSPEDFPGLFSEGGTFDALFVKLPQTIAEALKQPEEVPVTPPAPTTPPAQTATFDVDGDELTLVSTGTEDETTGETESTADAVVGDEAAVEPAPEPEPVVVDEATEEEATEEEATEEEVTEEPAEEVTEEPAEEVTETEAADDDEAADDEAADDEGAESGDEGAESGEE